MSFTVLTVCTKERKVQDGASGWLLVISVCFKWFWFCCFLLLFSVAMSWTLQAVVSCWEVLLKLRMANCLVMHFNDITVIWRDLLWKNLLVSRTLVCSSEPLESMMKTSGRNSPFLCHGSVLELLPWRTDVEYSKFRKWMRTVLSINNYF